MSTVETVTSTPISTGIEPLDDRGSAVRFESQCIVIPDPAHRSRRPRVVTKSYALPLWKRRMSPRGPSTHPPPEDASLIENQSHLVLRVPVPTLSRKPRSIARFSDHTPLPPCLIHRVQETSDSPSCSRSPSSARHSHTARRLSPSPSRPGTVTVPLRPCCSSCELVTEAALVSGDAWPEHFSHSASRRRSTSADGRPRTITVAGSAASSSYGNLGVSISVDEIDKRRRASDTGPLRTSEFDLTKTKEECRALVPLVLRHASTSGSSPADGRIPPSPTRMMPATPRIPEEEDEDESELFPLPSPKRTPSTSPAPSPAGSLSSLMAPQTNQCSLTNPSPSTCLGDSTGMHSSKRHFLAPPTCSSSSSLSLPKFSESVPDLAVVTDAPRAPSPNLLSAIPSLSGRRCSRSPSPRISCVPPTPIDTHSSVADSDLPKMTQTSESASAQTATQPTFCPPQPSNSPLPSPTQMRFSWRSRRSVSVDASSPSSSPRSPSTSPILSSSPNTKKSFSLSGRRHIITDVLRGVGAMGPSGIGTGM